MENIYSNGMFVLHDVKYENGEYYVKVDNNIKYNQVYYDLDSDEVRPYIKIHNVKYYLDEFCIS